MGLTRSWHIGCFGRFAVLPTPEQGRAVLVDPLKKCLKFILSKLDIDDTKTAFRNLSARQLVTLVKAIEKFEGCKEFETELVFKVTGNCRCRKIESRLSCRQITYSQFLSYDSPLS